MSAHAERQTLSVTRKGPGTSRARRRPPVTVKFQMEIVKVIGREILDSRGNPTVEADVYLADGTIGRAAVPSGASTGEHEAVELRDNDKSPLSGQRNAEGRGEYHEDDCSGAGRHGRGGANAQSIDKMIDLDGTPNKGKLGANAILAVSMAAARAAAESETTPLYTAIWAA